MKFPASTYRVQLSSDFSLRELQKNLDYLDDLGISTIYAAPFFQARAGSKHGYDVLNPFQINKEIGSYETLKTIHKELKAKNMDWLQDIVPNHMAFDGNNPWLHAIFELGPNSRYYNFFDINWDYKGWEKVMAPFLGATLEEVIENKELKLNFDENGFSIKYFDHSYPCSVRSYPEILASAGAGAWTEKFRTFTGNEEDWKGMKTFLDRELRKDNEMRENINVVVQEINSSGDKIREIIDLQYYIPTHWKHTEKEINYRRFFTINDLICLRMEDQKIFDTYHTFIHQLCKEGVINGLRIDHIDGLFDPPGYLEKLRELVGNDFYVIVEKILEWEEKLPVKWPIQGTSGYGFLAQANHLFTQTENELTFSETYKEINQHIPDYDELVYQKKLFILKERMGGELRNLWLLLQDQDLVPSMEKHKEDNYLDALSAFLAAFPVYRIYPEDFPLKDLQVKLIEIAYQRALDHFPEQKQELDYLKSIFFGERKKDEERMFYFLQRCQQFTGPLAAKGVEDTSFYIYNRLISHNEVGDSPENFGITVKDFHERMIQRKKNFPFSVNATATHDTKRGEDARMRLNVLSELPQEWFEKIEEWKIINKKIRKNKKVPDNNEEYFIYQTILGGMPFQADENFLTRTQDYLQKVLREAKVHSNWAEPDEVYETSVFEFIAGILENEEFKNSFNPFLKKIAHYGAIKSLGQALLKITAPGIPDVYQGTELWDFSYVDPDNRRPVNYDLRKSYLSYFKDINEDDLNDKIKSIKQSYRDGKVKMYTLHRALILRKNHPDLFGNGEYIPLRVFGKSSEQILSFARKHEKNWVVVVIPVGVTAFFSSESLVPQKDLLKETVLSLPDEAPKEWLNVFTGEIIETEKELTLESLFSSFPVGLLKSKF